ncbi:helix-turn-helix domain-containing protein [Streptomyces himalayensis]|uniref:helix-turn-helix domain-containing protein n=1 Tax=Streptomyces himalayensis TaxID=2820085 RepID=UPI0028682E2F|nr:helix-turn-helix domain-containing protein [Streptomyces himalayensis]
MTQYSSWAEVKRRMRENQPEVSDAEWESRKQAARTATEAHVVGYHLREIREEQGLTQGQVAQSLGISQARSPRSSGVRSTTWRRCAPMRRHLGPGSR